MLADVTRREKVGELEIWGVNPPSGHRKICTLFCTLRRKKDGQNGKYGIDSRVHKYLKSLQVTDFVKEKSGLPKTHNPKVRGSNPLPATKQ
jgi:hypothetical protein